MPGVSSETTRLLVDDGVALLDLGRHELKDLPEPEALSQLVIDDLPAEYQHVVAKLGLEPSRVTFEEEKTKGVTLVYSIALPAPLADPDWVAVRALVPRRDVNATMDDLAAIGAKAILASDIRVFRF